VNGRSYTGKVCEVIYDRFGDFESFSIESGCERHSFKSREKGIGEIVLRACCERIVVTVYVEPPPRNKIRVVEKKRVYNVSCLSPTQR
jgi:hypothetical protein